jgi:phytoene synthase
VARGVVEGRRVLMARKTSFYYSFLVLPPEQRRAIVAVWDFCRAVDDSVDEVGDAEATAEANARRRAAGLPPTGPAAVAFWRAELARCYDGTMPETAQGRRLQPFVGRLDLPRAAFEDVIDGVAMDLDTTRYATFADLFEYCRRVASAVGLICIKIFGCRGEGARDYALNLGVALQLTNNLRDVKDDLARGRVYLPLEDLAAHACSIDDLTAGRLTEPVRRVVAFECRRAREFYGRAVEVRPAEDRRRLVAAEIMRAVYFETLRRIERSGYDVFTARARVPRPVQAAIALGVWLCP